MREPFIIGEYYHIYNRGTDKRVVYMDLFDLLRFLQGMKEFNSVDPIGSIFEQTRKKSTEFSARSAKLVDFICYCLNPNHYHFILSPLVENGIEKFMQKLGAGYTMHINEKYNRTGALFQGKYKSIHIDSDKYLMYLSAYVNLNNRIHKFSARSAKLENGDDKLFWKSSWKEYLGENNENFCNKSIVLDRYESVEDYKEFAGSVVKGVIEGRIDESIVLDGGLLIEKM